MGWCAFGRYDLHTQGNAVDLIDFSQNPPARVSAVIGLSPPGFGFGRAVSVNGHDGKALYGSYSLSSTPNQYRLQFDYLDLKAYKKYTLGYDYTAAAGNFPLSISRAGAAYGIAHQRGVDTVYSLTNNCGPVNFRGRGTGSGSSDSGEPKVPCEDLPPINVEYRF